MYIIKKHIVFFLAIILSIAAFCQDDSTITRPADTLKKEPTNLFWKRPLTREVKKYSIAIFTPLYLDSAFDAAYNYRYEKNFPKFINPGLEFYEGVKLALDSLNKEKIPLEVFVFDTRSGKPLQQKMASLDTVHLDLMIGYATMEETWLLADSARAKKIPFINVNLPNDGGIVNNPYFVILNPTLKTHVEGVYRYLQKYYSLNTITVFRKKGSIEDMIKRYMDDFSQATVSIPLKIKYVDLVDSFSASSLLPYLDSSRQNVCVSGSLDDQFNRRLLTLLAQLKNPYKTTIVGMPTFDNLEKDFAKSEFHGPEIIYGDPFYNPRTNKVSTDIINYFNAKMFARPSDMVMRGYETAWRFIKLLLKYKDEFAANLGAKEFNVFREFDIQPVQNREFFTLNYYENKKLYFIRWQDGVMKVVN